MIVSLGEKGEKDALHLDMLKLDVHSRIKCCIPVPNSYKFGTTVICDFVGIVERLNRHREDKDEKEQI